MAIPFGPDPIGVAIPPTSAASATASSSARRNPLFADSCSHTGRKAPIMSAAAATFDIHIESTAVARAASRTSGIARPRDNRSVCSTSRRSAP